MKLYELGVDLGLKKTIIQLHQAMGNVAARHIKQSLKVDPKTALSARAPFPSLHPPVQFRLRDKGARWLC